ncbi:zinc finger CCCH domain-containing protein 25-like [Glycine soja]|nr:zinc finger CCCH domain-containing protein 25-like [Glycine soja]XP_028214396.1 zinc finger CCCH domain-containing protein 25-like [Glycine soja]RZC26263.1 Zinc finger CCCH domain-containing protein 42 isoform A [Glycine soja]RZC26264.1 Zinc finger CCCH domain-containing protein 42 isoform B [Glycine soja]
MNPLTLVKRTQNINAREAALGIGEQASWHTKYKDSAYVFVGGIPFDLTEGDLLAVFAQYGEVVDVNLVRDKGTGKSKGFAFLAYEDQRSTNLAVDNLNGAQVLGRIIRVDHVDKYKKKEEEDEETERQKREARGVCRAFQRGECTRGASCKFSHDEQRAANTGWGREEDKPKWGHDKFEGPKKERRSGNNQSNHIPETRDRDSRTRARNFDAELDNQPKKSDRRETAKRWHDNNDDKFEGRENNSRREENRSRRHEDDDKFEGRENNSRREDKRSRRHEDDDKFEGRENNSKREEKRSRRHGDDEFEHKSREDGYRREEKGSRMDDYDGMELEPKDQRRREDKRSIKPDDVEFEPKSRDSDIREDKKSRRRDDDDFLSKSREPHSNREDMRSRKHGEDESAPKSRENYARKQDDRSYRNDSGRTESKERYDFDRREEKRPRR